MDDYAAELHQAVAAGEMTLDEAVAELAAWAGDDLTELGARSMLLGERRTPVDHEYGALLWLDRPPTQ